MQSRYIECVPQPLHYESSFSTSRVLCSVDKNLTMIFLQLAPTNCHKVVETIPSLQNELLDKRSVNV